MRTAQTDEAVFLNDEWRARTNWTLSLGLRYEKQTNIHDRTNYGPRVAMAWAPGGKNGGSAKTVFRLGSGLFYFRVDRPLLYRRSASTVGRRGST